LLIVFACLERQFGFALEIADYALQQYNDPLFTDSRTAVLKKIKQEKLKIPLVMARKKLRKIFAAVNA